MRMLVPLAALLIAVPASAAPLQLKRFTPKEICASQLRHADGRARAKIWRDEPTRADLHAAVYRTENGCPVPAILRRGAGSR